MSLKNTGAFTQFGRAYSVNITTLNGGSLTAPTQTGLVAVAGPDGMDIWEIGAVATATQTSANVLSFFTSGDFGTTFTALPITATFAASAAVGAALNIPMPNAVPMGPTNAMTLGGVPGPFTHTMSLSQITENSIWYQAQYPSAGSANAQTLAQLVNTSNAPYGAALAQYRIIDFVAGLTNTGALTIAPGGVGATAVTTPTGGALTGGEVTKGFRYRLIDTGAALILLPTQRLYVAMNQTQALTVTAWGADR